jgi:CubicO group peptidase (beta-lactamase class C family)
VSVDDARKVVERGCAAGVFPSAAFEAGSSTTALIAGTCDASLQSPFDLASLTKVIATTTIIMELVRAGFLALDEPVSAFFDEWRGADREAVTVRDLLEHASGLPARLLDAPPLGRREFEHDICTTRLEYEPRTRSIYSDLGFILLGFLAADRGGAPLPALFDRIATSLQTDLTFDLLPDVRRLALPTRPMDEDPRRGRALTGEVHDNYAAALGGAAGHAGLFGSAAGIGVFARAILTDSRRGEPLISLFTRKSEVPGSSRALGWDTMLPTSSCGTRMSPQAFGHVGYTGTSLWLDPARDRYFILLTNRVFGSGTLEEMRNVRRAFHDALGDL